MKRRMLLLSLAALAALVLASCGGEKTVPDLTGEWVQPGDENIYQSAVITDDTIEINWNLRLYHESELYWHGSFTPPDTPGNKYSWESVNDLEMAKTSRRASREEIKTFTYKNGELSYNVTIGHLRMSVTLVRPETLEDGGAD